MAYISFNPNNYFRNKLHTGTGSAQSITFNESTNMTPDFIWIKRRESFNHRLIDSARGSSKFLSCNTTDAESTDTAVISSFDTNGFSVGDDTSVNASGGTYVSWNWKAGTTSGITTNGSTVITPSAYSFSATSGFSVVKYTGNGNTTTKVAHGLGAAPKWIIIKKTSAGGDNWTVYHIAAGNDTSLQLDNNGGTSGGSDRFYDVTPDTVNFTLGNHTSVNASSATYIAYCFAEKSGFSSFGKYIGNASTNGPFIHCGFKPAWFMIKRIGSGYSWAMKDNKINPNNPVSVEMYANDSSGDTAGSAIDFLSNGVKIRSNSGTYNHSGISYAYMAFAEEPFVASNGDPATAR